MRGLAYAAFSATIFAATAPAKADAALDRISERSGLSVCTSAEDKPFAFVDSSGEAKGFHIDLIEDLRKRLSDTVGKTLSLDIVAITPANRMQFLQQGKCDLVLTSMNVTPERAKVVKFVEPGFYYSGANILARKGIEIESWEDIRGRSICSFQGSVWNTPYEQRYGTMILAYAGWAETVQSVLDGRCEGWLADDALLFSMLSTEAPWNEFEIKLSTQDGSPWGVAIPFDMPDLDAFVSDTVKDWHRAGLMLQLEEKWNVPASAFAKEQHELFKSN